MNKSEIIKALSQKIGLTKNEAAIAINAFMDIIEQQVALGDDVNLRGFGRFQTIYVESNSYRNPATGEISRTNKKKKVRFKGGSDLSDKVN